jgi:hypothetical protein
MTIFSSQFLGWNLLSSRFVIGTYYGILATLPLAPSQILSIRVLLLEDENKQGRMIGAGAAKGIFIAGVSGFLIAQFAIFLSIYCLPLYTVWFKPHVFHFLLPVFLLWHYLRIVEFDPVAHLIPNYKYPFLDPRVRTAFLESFLLQIINPIVLPNPVFTRLISIFLFRYSHIPMFVFGSLIGWLGGQFLFISLSWLLLSRLQLDSPNVYRIVRRIVHWAFPPIIMSLFLSYMGRVSMVPLYRKPYRNQKFLLYNLWPDICYNRNRTSHSTHFMLSSHQSKLHNQTNAPFNTLNTPLHKQHFSQYFFEVCIRDGKQRLSHNYPISLSIIQNDFKQKLRFSERQDILEEQWANKRQIRLFYFYQTIRNKVTHLDKGVQEVLEKRVSSINRRGLDLHNLSQYINKNMTSSMELSSSMRKYIQSSDILSNYIRKIYDTRLGSSLRKEPKIVKNQSPWFINQNKDTQILPALKRNYLTRWKLDNKRLNRLKKIILKMKIYNVYFHLYKKIPIWKSRSKFYSFSYEFNFFKKNLTRRRRRKFFVRSFVIGSTSGRSRNIAGIPFHFLETKPRSSFFLRSKEIRINSEDESYSKKRVSQTESEKFDFSTSHSVRGPALITQAFIRKYVKLPALIVGKNLVRLLLMQSSEWDQDWEEWNREKYLYCYYNGNYVPDDQMPPHWFGTGLQIKILFPLYLTPWRPSIFKKNILSDNMDPIFSRSSYINIWGQETDVPFGEVQYIPFFKPIVRGSIVFSQHQFAKILRLFNNLWVRLEEKYNIVQSFVYKRITTFDKNINKETSKLITGEEKLNLYSNNAYYKSLSQREQLNKINQGILSLKTETFKTNETSNKKLDLNKQNKDGTIFEIEKFEEKNQSFVLNKISDSNRIINQNIDNNFLKKNSYVLNKRPLLIQRKFKYENMNAFPIYLIFKRTDKYTQYQKIKLDIVVIQIYQELIAFRKYVCRMFSTFIRILHRKTLQSQRSFVKNVKRCITFCSKKMFTIKIKLITFVIHRTLLDTESEKNNMHVTDKFHKIYLSHAYLLHKIWQNHLMNRLSIQRISMDWKPDHPLQDHIYMILHQQGLLKSSPQNISLDNLQEWLRPFRRYTPPPEIWYQLSPHIWRKKLNEFWVKKNSFIYDFQYKKTFSRNYAPKNSSYYTPLFEKSKKMMKRWQFNLLMHSYTSSLKSHHINDVLVGWQTNARQNNQLVHLQLIKNKSDFKKNIITSTSRTWGLTNTRTNGLVVSFPLIKSFNGSLVSKKKLYISPIQPLYYKYKNLFSLEDNEVPTFKKRVSFKPIVQYRWKSEQDRFKALTSIDIIRKVKSDLKNAVKKSMLAKKHKLKSAAVFAEKAQEAALQWERLNLSPFTCKTIRKRQAKVLDDEILMHSIVTSFLKFKSKCVNIQHLGLADPSVNQLALKKKGLLNHFSLTAEEILLPRSLREYKILSLLNFQSQTNLNQFFTNTKSSMVQTDEKQIFFVMPSLLQEIDDFVDRYIVFADRYIENIPFQLMSRMINNSFLLLLDIVRPQSVEGARLFFYLNGLVQTHVTSFFKKKSNSRIRLTDEEKEENINIRSSTKLNIRSSTKLIRRYLWPTYRAEDLACMNRCLINTANQARFSSLRIRLYPNLRE